MAASSRVPGHVCVVSAGWVLVACAVASARLAGWVYGVPGTAWLPVARVAVGPWTRHYSWPIVVVGFCAG